MKQIYTLVLLSLFLCLPAKMKSVTAYPFPIEYKQPNGETITIQMHGDEYFHYVTTLDGSLIAYDANGYYKYAVINSSGQLVPGSVMVSSSSLRSSQSGILKADSEEFLTKVQQPALARVIEEKLSARSNDVRLRASTAVTGSRRGLVILANFKDKQFTVSDATNAFTKMLNQAGYSDNGGTGSARDFYMNNSNNQFTPQFDVYGPVDLPNNMSFYGANDSNGNDVNPEQMIVDACQAAKAKYSDLNFANYDYDKDKVLDFVFVFYAGYNEAENGGANTVWPHKYNVADKNVSIDGVKLDDYACTSELKGNSGTNQAGIGTFTHEFGHVLGLPDLYDADDNVNGKGPGIGNWCTMGSGSYLNEGRTPPNFGAMERYMLGWIDPTVITATTSSVNKALSPITNSTGNQVFRLNTTTAEEYYLFEARKKQGWDTYLPGEGMLVYHIDRTTAMNKTVTVNGTSHTVSAANLWDAGIPNIIGDHQCMDMLRANNVVGTYAGNPYPGTSNITTITDYTTPGFLTWNKDRTYVQISSITRNATDGSVSFSIVKNTVSPYPYIQTNAVTNVLQTTATLNASLLENGPSPVTERGFCWSTTVNPTTQNTTVKVSGTALGAYTANISSLTMSTTYHVRAYVKTQDGNVYYGNDVSFMTLVAKQNLPFTEDFKNGIPSFWTIKDKNNDGVTWQPASLVANGQSIGVATIKGNSNVANDWLITPQLAIPSNLGNIALNFYVAISSAQKLNLMVSDGSMDDSSFSLLGSITYPYDQTPGSGIIGWFTFTDNPISLNSYMGKSIFLAFVGATENGGTADGLYMTNISLTTQYKSGIEKTNVNVPLVYVQDKYVYFKNVSEKFTAEIYDTTGRLHYKVAVPSDMSQLVNESGIYIVKLSNDKQTYTYKLIIR